MLLRFGVLNHLSIREYQELSLVAAPIKDAGADLFDLPNFRLKTLPSVAIYGANAAGKSNFLRSLHRMCSLIVQSHQKGKPGSKLRRDFFALDPASATTPSQFDCDFILNSDRYHYGFSFNDDAIIEEWLYFYSGHALRKSRKVLFHRKKGDKPEFYFGTDLKGPNKQIENFTRENSLFLSSAAANNHKQLLSVYEYFDKHFEFERISSAVSQTQLAKRLFLPETKEKVLDFLKHADIGIIDIEAKKIETSDNEKAKEFSRNLRDLINKFTESDIPEKDHDDEFLEVVIKHRGFGGAPSELPISDESSGTQALLSLLGPVYSILSNGGILIIDELNTNLHPVVSRNLISLFNSSETNPGRAQLLFSTHDTNLLCGGILRRDQIWFAEKDTFGATNIYPLSDITTRSTDNILKGYLEGRFGAVPFLGNWKGMR